MNNNEKSVVESHLSWEISHEEMSPSPIREDSNHPFKINIHDNANITEDVQKEINLVDYTESKINTWLINPRSNIAIDNESYHNNPRNNSPITVSDSNNNSASDISDDDSQSETERNDIKNERVSTIRYKKLSYNDVEKSRHYI